MPLGPGKYDKECTELFRKLNAHGIILAVFAGNKGTGFSVNASFDVTIKLPAILREMADQIEKSIEL